jgi:hypothetical protein
MKSRHPQPHDDIHAALAAVSRAIATVESVEHNAYADAAFDALPTELEIVQMLNEDHSLTLPLCVMYVQDFKCLAEHYSMPAPCAALLQAVASGEERSTLRSTDSPCSE